MVEECGDARIAGAPLLLQQGSELKPGQRDRDQRVAERLRGVQVAVRDRSLFRVRPQVGADAAGIGERDDSALFARRRQLGVGDESPQRMVPAGRRVAVKHAGELTDGPSGQWCRALAVVRDDCGDLGVRGRTG